MTNLNLIHWENLNTPFLKREIENFENYTVYYSVKCFVPIYDKSTNKVKLLLTSKNGKPNILLGAKLDESIYNDTNYTALEKLENCAITALKQKTNLNGIIHSILKIDMFRRKETNIFDIIYTFQMKNISGELTNINQKKYKDIQFFYVDKLPIHTSRTIYDLLDIYKPEI